MKEVVALMVYILFSDNRTISLCNVLTFLVKGFSIPYRSILIGGTGRLARFKIAFLWGCLFDSGMGHQVLVGGPIWINQAELKQTNSWILAYSFHKVVNLTEVF